MPATEVTVFGRVGDFKRALRASPPDAAIALASVLEVFGQKPSLQGVQGGKDKEQYLLISEHVVDLAALQGMTVGCLDLVGRRNLPEFVRGVLGGRGALKVQRVTKVEDLLQLLHFQRADAILLPERFLEGIKSRTKMELKVLAVPGAQVLRTAVAFPGNRSAVEASIKGISTDVILKLGVDGWR